jgi:hypothetical protein
MGQTASTQQEQPSEPVIRVHYTSRAPSIVGRPETLTIRLSGLKDIKYARAISELLQKDALHGDLYVTVDIGLGFVSTGVLGGLLDANPELAGVFSNLYLLGLNIDGDFAGYVSREDRIAWWNSVQSAVTTMGLGFRFIGVVICYAVKPGFFTIDAQPGMTESMEDKDVNINGFVFSTAQY